MSTTNFYIFAVCFLFHQYEIVQTKIMYATYKEERTRATPYDPYVIAKTCLLKPDPGPCRSEIPMYYYVPSQRNCSIFSWGGCQGNGNRFDSHEECTESCLSRPNPQKMKPKWCALNFDYGFCFGSIDRWYYDPLWKVCKQRIYSGCGGNKNNFYNKEQCDSICRFGAGVVKHVTKDRSGMRKVLVVNSVNATTKKAKDQKTQPKIAEPGPKEPKIESKSLSQKSKIAFLPHEKTMLKMVLPMKS